MLPRSRAALVPLAAGALLCVPAAHAQFLDRTATNGLVWRGATWGASFGDIDGDGDLDLYSGHHTSAPLLYWNNGLGEFDWATYPQPWTGPLDRHGAILISLDTDEDLDVFVTHGAHGGAGAEPNELYRNDGPGNLRLLLGAGGASDPQGRARSVSAADFDGDHRVDLWVGEAPDATNRNSLFRNLGSLTFTDAAASAGIAESLGTVGGIWGDVDDDGDQDLLVGGEEFARPTVLWRNDGGVFADASGLFTPALPVVSGADWGDFDNDGDLDLAVVDGNVGVFDSFAEGDTLTYYFNTRWGDAGLDGITVPSTADTTWGQFRILARVDTSRIFLGPAAVRPPLMIAIPLTDAYVGAPTFTPGVSRGTYVWRVSPGGPWEVRCSTPNLNSDTFDGFLRETLPITGVTPVDLENPNLPPGGPRVWRNDGGVFVEITTQLGLALMLNPRDVSWVDYDNDGDLDLHVVDMGTSAAPNAPDRLWRNDGPGAPFADVTAAEGVAGGTDGMGDGAIWGDIDGDLDLDLFLQEGGGPATFRAPYASRLLLNKGERGNALLLDLVGRESGPPAIGTRVTVVAGGLRVHRRVQANAWRGFQDPRVVHVGLGAAAVADSVIVRWPAGGVQTFLDVPAGASRILEGNAAVSAPPASAPAGAAWSVRGVAPQPAEGLQHVRIDLAREMSLEVVVQDVTGRVVRKLHAGPLEAGRAEVAWDGRDARGRRVAAGVYWIRVTDGEREGAAKSVRLR